MTPELQSNLVTGGVVVGVLAMLKGLTGLVSVLRPLVIRNGNGRSKSNGNGKSAQCPNHPAVAGRIDDLNRSQERIAEVLGKATTTLGIQTEILRGIQNGQEELRKEIRRRNEASGVANAAGN